SENKQRPTAERMIALMVFFSGRVQGVGFRATAASLARDYPVTGWVKNLSDGRVQLLAEGPEEAVRAFLHDVRAPFRGGAEDERDHRGTAPRLRSLLNDWANANDRVKEMHYRFRLTREDHLYGSKKVWQGEVFLKRPDLLRVNVNDAAGKWKWVLLFTDRAIR